jgi:hypothetical protein
LFREIFLTRLSIDLLKNCAFGKTRQRLPKGHSLQARPILLRIRRACRLTEVSGRRVENLD